MTQLVINKCGPLTSIQDRGRQGWLRFGLSAAGAADPIALFAANLLVGNSPDTACIELVMTGGAFEAVGGSARLAVAGARMPMTLDGERIAGHTSFVLQPGSILHVGAAQTGVYAVLAVEGGLDIAPELGSRSLHARAGIGGLGGTYLTAGSILPLVKPSASLRDEAQVPPLPLAPVAPLRAVLGPQQHKITRAALETFFTSQYTVTAEVDRMGCRLAGPRIDHTDGFNIVSDGIVGGSIQIPGSGQPIVMLVDRQTTGGYPKIATVITPDVRLLMHRRPGEAVTFQTVTVERSREIAQWAAKQMAELRHSMRPVTALVPADAAISGNLAELNLAGDALSALDPLTWPRQITLPPELRAAATPQ